MGSRIEELHVESLSASESKWSPLVDYRRDGVTEVTIHGAVAWWSGDRLVHLYGDDALIFGRSLTKPYQMKVFARELAAGVSIESQAVSVASHNAERAQIEAARAFLNDEELEKIETPFSMPLVPGEQSHSGPDRWFHPCSGKHAAILRGCRIKGWSQEGYLSQDHPYHQAYLAEVRNVLGQGWKPSVTAVDGCGLPTPSMKVSELAHLYARLVSTRREDWIWDAMVKRPDMVGGRNRLDTLILESCGGRVLAKEGADGLLGLAIEHASFPQGLGVVIKIASGWNPVATSFVARAILSSLGYNVPSFGKIDRQEAFVDVRCLLAAAVK